MANVFIFLYRPRFYYGRTTGVGLSAEHVRQILVRASRDAIRSMGFDLRHSHPRNLVLTVLPVAPPCLRPCRTPCGKNRMNDDLTCRYHDIITVNNKIRALKHSEGNYARKAMELQECYAELVLASHSEGRRGNRPTISIEHRVKGKKGRVRQNLLGKRGDYCARCVITPDPQLRIDEVGIPAAVAARVTVQCVVGPYNYERLSRMVQDTLDGRSCSVQHVIVAFGDIKTIRKGQYKRFILDEGYIVERVLQDGDIVLFNRQPTLHKMSMMAHRVRIVTGNAFRLNLSVTGPYNADFDGDAMVFSAPQSYAAQSEMAEIALASRNIVTSQTNGNCIGVKMDALLGAYLLCQDNVALGRLTCARLLGCARQRYGAVPPPNGQTWTGRQLLSCLLPRGLWYTHAGVRIVDGNIEAGAFAKAHLGCGAGTLIHRLFLDHGPTVAADFVDDLRLVVHAWLVQRGFSVGVADFVLDATVHADIATHIESADAVCAAAGEDSAREYAALNAVITQCGTAALNSLHDNSVVDMVKSGAKGNLVNVSQIMALVGQQSVNGARVSPMRGGYTLPQFAYGTRSPDARGFVRNSFYSGLASHEFFFAAMAGREGVSDTACKTRDVGYLTRQLSMYMKDLCVAYDGTVRDECGRLVQFRYGEDGLDATYLEPSTCPYTANVYGGASGPFEPMDDATFARMYAGGGDAEYAALCRDRAWMQTYFPALMCTPGETVVHFIPPVWDWRDVDSTTDDDGDAVMQHTNNETVTWVLAEMATLGLGRLTGILCRERLCWRVQQRRGAAWPLARVAADLVARARRAIVDPGEAVGQLAALCISEPTQQMTLNTFHYSGVADMNATYGITRVKELLRATQSIKGSCLAIFPIDKTEWGLQQLITRLEYVPLNAVIAGCNVGTELPADYEILAGVHADAMWRVEMHMRAGTDTEAIAAKIRRQRSRKQSEKVQVMLAVPPALVLRVRSPANDGEASLCRELMRIRSLSVSGIKGISDVRYDPNEGILRAKGYDLHSVLCTEGVDTHRTISNSIMHVYEALGIEAARTVLLEQILLAFKATYINYHHLCLLVDSMTYWGEVLAITMFGLRKGGSSPYKLIAYEHVFDNLRNAAVFGQTDELRDASSRVIHGQRFAMGTNSFDVFLNENALANVAPLPPPQAVSEVVDEDAWGDVFEPDYRPPAIVARPPVQSAAPSVVPDVAMMHSRVTYTHVMPAIDPLDFMQTDD